MTTTWMKAKEMVMKNFIVEDESPIYSALRQSINGISVGVDWMSLVFLLIDEKYGAPYLSSFLFLLIHTINSFH